MKITIHQSIERFKKFEYPVTLIDDNNRIFDTVIYSDKIKETREIETAAIEYSDKIKQAEANKPKTETILVSEVETVLREKKLITEVETYYDWKNKTAIIPEQIIKGK